MIVASFDHENEWKLATIGRISSYDLVLYVFVGTMNRNINFFFHYSKEKKRFSHFRHNYEISVLYPFSSKIILLNQVSGFVWKFLNFKLDILHSNDGKFQYSKGGQDIIIHGMEFPHKIE